MGLERIRALFEELRTTVLQGRGVTEPALRRAAASWAAVSGGCHLSDSDELPEALAAYVDTVACHAYRVTDEQVAALLSAGYSEDAVFEITVSTALGPGLARLERGLAALEGANDAAQTTRT